MEYYKSVLRIVILATLLPKSQSIPGPRVTTPGHTRPQPTEQYVADKLSGVVPDEGNQRINGTIMIRGNNFTYLDIEQVREQVTPEGELYREIMSNYDKNTRPIINASEVVNINLTFTFHQVLDVEEKEQILSVILTMDHHWWDEKLVWNPTDFNNISQLKLPSSDIWLPDIVLYNTAEDRIKKPSSSSMSRAFVKYDGQIYWPPVRKFQSTCNIDITYFPFDDQICYLKLGSWAYDGFQVDVWNTMELMEMSQASTNSEFQVVNSSVRKFITYYDCCLEPYPDVKVYIHIRRKTIQHVFNIVIPCIVLSIICMVGFLIPPDKIDEKISVQLTVLFSLSLFMLLVAESTPRTSESVPLISIYLTALMCITAMSTTAHVVCDKLVASSKVRNQVPYLANKLIYRLARLCQNNKLLNKKKEDEGEENEEFMYENGNTIELKENGSKEQNGTKPKQGMKLETGKRDLLGPSSNGRLKRGASQMERVRRLNTRQKRGQSVSFTPGNLGKQKKPLNDDTEEGLQGLFHHLKIRQDKMRTEFQETAKWYKVATKMDKIFFWGYGISVTILTFYAFIFKPMQKDVQL